MPELPQPLPTPEATPTELLVWAAKATQQAIVGTWRPAHSEHAPLLVRLDSGREVFFDSVGEACGAKRFFSAFIGVGGVTMPTYSEPQVRVIVSALVRAAQLSHELDDRDFWGDTGATFLRSCLTAGNLRTIVLDLRTEDEIGRLARYHAACRYSDHLGGLADEVLPKVLVAVDRESLLIPRGAFLVFANRRRRGLSPGVINAQMQRLGWEILDLCPRKPGMPMDYPRPHLRLWQIANGWDGLHVEIEDGEVVAIDADRGSVVPPGPTEYARATPTLPMRESGTRRNHGTRPEDQGTAS